MVKPILDTPKQDMPPEGGFPNVKYQRNLPKKGPSGLVVLLLGAAVMTAGLSVVAISNKKKRAESQPPLLPSGEFLDDEILFNRRVI
mmetsp:Transcript_4907/g.7655  ORF Transcript_4907/g.7655 Transcript_4907/m.7655 type:complete len:87 (+) Transcript_4907:74-334(+)|eukprot:CAMPEP_0184645678 /NCGR_PEP_ID=MMETSP0308-20130426/2227_1 /TAXON_ID=38269 /ORGANISM="Gloeochaete witrockiana, Strain SAG 46.84" /LENGTH=86 /DNA_ID=CAMNT_0027074949 /DNA_START=61 /DNA_END=321 /DNA_ORIENTATION=-